jgi:hypothetical protein
MSKESFMDITAINRGATGMHAPALAIFPDKTSENRAVVQAAKALNRTEMFGGRTSCFFKRTRNRNAW